MRSERRKALDDARAERRAQSSFAWLPDTRTVWFLPVLVSTIAVLTSGCVAPCSSGVCNSQGSLFSLPTPRYNATEQVIDNGCGGCETGRPCKSKAYPTFNKYCPWFDEWHTTSTAKKCANRILFRQQWHTKKLMPADYKAGFRQAFIDVAHGSDGELPAVAPPVYWNTHFRNDSGHRRAECWFAGYRAGAAAAAVQLAPMKRIAASYDWTVEKPREPFADSGCAPCGRTGVGPRPLGQAVPTGCPPGPPPVPGQPFPQAGQFGQWHPQGLMAGPPSGPQQFAPQQFAPQQFAPQQFAPQPVPSHSVPSFPPQPNSLPAQPLSQQSIHQPLPAQAMPPQPMHQQAPAQAMPLPAPALPGHSSITPPMPPAYSGSAEPVPGSKSIQKGGPGLIGPSDNPPNSSVAPSVPAVRPGSPAGGGSLQPGFSSGPSPGGSGNWNPPEGLVY